MASSYCTNARELISQQQQRKRKESKRKVRRRDRRETNGKQKHNLRPPPPKRTAPPALPTPAPLPSQPPSALELLPRFGPVRFSQRVQERQRKCIEEPDRNNLAVSRGYPAVTQRGFCLFLLSLSFHFSFQTAPEAKNLPREPNLVVFRGTPSKGKVQICFQIHTTVPCN